MKPIFYIILSVTLAVVAPLAVQAQEINRTQRIAEQCQMLTSLISQLQRRDLVSRTNLGREYETINKQLTAFNQRLRHNNIDAKPYEQLSAQFVEATNTFRAAYVRYDDSIIKLLAVDCQKRPADFDTQLIAARLGRQATLEAANQAAYVLSQYRDLVLSMASLQAGGESG